MGIKYSSNKLNRSYKGQPTLSTKNQTGARAADGVIRSISSFNNLDDKKNQIRIHTLLRGIGRFNILVFTSDMFARLSGIWIQNSNIRDIIQSVNDNLSRWRSRWSYKYDFKDGCDSNNLFRAHIISGSVDINENDQVYIDSLIKRKEGDGRIYLDDEKQAHQNYEFDWSGGEGGIVIVRPDSHICYRVVGVGETAWRDVEEYLISILS
jgi:hypothetical protein